MEPRTTPTTAKQLNPALDNTDYERIARAIAWIDAHALEQPTSAAIAAAAGLSEAHFSRLFKRWAGIAPGRYVKQRTVIAARNALDAGASVLAASIDSGLSGPGRLHDLFVSIEALSPGEYKRGGAGLKLHYGFGATPFGHAFVLHGTRGIVELGFCAPSATASVVARLADTWHSADLVLDLHVQPLIDRAFFGGGERVALNPVGTNFQLQIWRALLRIPTGATSTYAQIAASVQKPRAARAVGNAIGANNIAWLIPCHRVLRTNGALGGYRWGTERKATMLCWESARSAAL